MMGSTRTFSGSTWARPDDIVRLGGMEEVRRIFFLS
jgi:hypothetical protein